jgi:coenzyme PQQ synthesis protein D (PqqD)
MSNRNEDFSFAVNSEATVSVHDGGIVILHIGNGRLYTSNGTGARIWCGVEEHLPLEAITDRLSDEYQIDPATAREHILCFLTQLEVHTLIQREAES